jgi:hypothetical protein
MGRRFVGENQAVPEAEAEAEPRGGRSRWLGVRALDEYAAGQQRDVHREESGFRLKLMKLGIAYLEPLLGGRFVLADGILLTWLEGEVRMVGACPYCASMVPSQAIHNLYGLGEMVTMFIPIEGHLNCCPGREHEEG